MRILLLALMLMISGCASQKWIHYTHADFKEGTPEEERALKKDDYNCDKDARMLPARDTSELDPMMDALEGIADSEQRRRFFFKCMESKGWNIEISTQKPSL